MRLRLRTRVALAFAVLSFVVAAVVSTTTYLYGRSYLLNQRQNAALTRAILDARAAATYLSAGATATEAVAEVPSVGTSTQMVRVSGAWGSSGPALPVEQLPPALLQAADPHGSQQRVVINSEPYFAVAVPIGDNMYVEVFPLRDLDRTLRWGAWVLLTLCVLAAAFGALIGVTAFGRILGPLRRVGDGASRIASGELGTRIAPTQDPDLDQISQAFNDMAEAVQERIERERRFSANVSHELRSPLTSVLGTAELLEARKEQLPPREAGLVTVLVQQVRRMSSMLLDLLEISRINAVEPPQWESADIAGLCRDVAADRGLSPDVVVGDRPVVGTDARRLERIIGNLIDNAERHGGGVAQVVVERDADVVRIFVDDAGPGVDDAIKDRVFEPFTRGTANLSADGAGLGLAIVREQAAALGGEVSIDSAPSGGARFVAVLPVREVQA